MGKYSQKMIVVIDVTRCLIRIHRKTLEALEKPAYINLLINPEKPSFAIMSSEKNQRSYRIPWEKLSVNGKSFELYCTELIRNIKAICKDWRGKGAYKLLGELNSNSGIIQFDMKKAVEVRGDL